MTFAVIILAPFLLALLLLFLRQYLPAAQQGWLLAGSLALSFIGLITQISQVSDGAVLLYSLPWMPQIGLELSLYIDGLSLFFALIITGMGAVVMWYGGYYFEKAQEAGRFLALLMAFTGSMLALVMAGNLITMFIAWELTSIISFLLISFKGEYPEARSGASQALVITGGGGLALFAGLLIMGNAAGSYSFSDILASGEILRAHPWVSGFTLLLLLGAFSKSAQFPLHFWLPGAMSAPTPASAFLHSATMVKAGIYLLLRFYPTLGETIVWSNVVPVVGLVTMIVSATISLRQQDLKGVLAYSTISQLGALTALAGLPNGVGIKAAILGVVGHALYKGALFLVAGTVDHATGTRLIAKLGGLRAKMPGLAVVTAIAVFSMAGVPPMLGFVAKELMIEAVLHDPLALAIVIISAAFTFVAGLRIAWDVFMGQRAIPPEEAEEAAETKDAYPHFHAVPAPLVLAPAILAVLSVVFGVLIAPLLSGIVVAAYGKPTSLYLFPPGGINEAFIMSLVALSVGLVIFLLRRFWLKIPIPAPITGAIVYQKVIRLVEMLGDLLLKMQVGTVRHYLFVILTVVAILLSTVLFSEFTIDTFRRLTLDFNDGVADVLKIMLLSMTLIATLASILFERHLLAALSLGVAGYSIGGLFLLEPAPDVALVQFLVETVVTVLTFIILARISQDERRRAMERLWGQSNRGLIRDLALSIAIGVAVSIFALASVASRPHPSPISTWHLENALPQAGVTDVVAGIITDFRGVDTLIEITVFSMAGLGVLTMLARPNPSNRPTFFQRWRQRRRGKGEYLDALQEDAEREEPRLYESHFQDPITQFAAVLVLPISLMLALAHILYGSSAPGDGFTAGVIAGLGISLWYIVFGYDEAKRRFKWLHLPALIGIGLVLAFANAALPMLFGQDFLTLTKITSFSFADIKLASSLVYEIAIFLTVSGGVGVIMEAISHPKEVEPL
jgi:NADH:ubiquinone oxidoreductase subunit 5 (subunit L)/multisubunit Na+/H+ antiporter MnhA subunit/multisubunit Na+/H+ antiporter MnhB subunit